MIAQTYQPQDCARWNRFVAASKNGTFLHNRSYMEYHSDRFKDHSVIFTSDDRIVAALPANSDGHVLVSHGGLTYGGLITDRHMKTAEMLAVFEALAAYGRKMSVKRIVYKTIPHIYHAIPSEEDLYAISCYGGILVKRDVSSAIYLPEMRIPGKRARAGRKLENSANVAETKDWEAFFDMVHRRLDQKYGVRPVHTAKEMQLLAGRFPENIRLYGAYSDGTLLAGALMYETSVCAHVQYISSTEEGRRIRALDLLIPHLLNAYRHKRWFDFGISTEENGKKLNDGLIRQKEEFGASAVCYDTYEIQI